MNNTLAFSFFGQSSALQGNLHEIYRKLWKYCHPSDLNHICRAQMAENDLSESKMTNMDPVMELIFTKMIPCPGVGILKMIHCSAARPHTEKYMSTSPGTFSRFPLSNHALLLFIHSSGIKVFESKQKPLTLLRQYICHRNVIEKPSSSSPRKCTLTLKIKAWCRSFRFRHFFLFDVFVGCLSSYLFGYIL